jgi:integrase
MERTAMAKQKRRPSYLLHQQTGQARTKINGRLYYLGEYGSRESRERYDDLIREWCLAQDTHKIRLTIDDLALLFLEYADTHYRHRDGTPTGTADTIRFALRPLIARFGRTAVRDFGPRALKEVRSDMIAAGHSRTYINDMVARIKRMFKWGVQDEHVPPAVYQALAAVEGLEAGRTSARELKPIPAVAEGTVNDTLPHLPRVVADMVRLQLLTGMRPGEVCSLRPCDVTRSTNGVWTYRPEHHKTEHPRTPHLHRPCRTGCPSAVPRPRSGGLLLQSGGIGSKSERRAKGRPPLADDAAAGVTQAQGPRTPRPLHQEQLQPRDRPRLRSGF